MCYWRRFVGVIIGLAIILTPAGLRAAEPPVLNLHRLITLALEYSPQIKVSKSEVEVAKQQRQEAKGYFYPQIEALVTTGVVPNARRPEVRSGKLYYPDPSNRIHGLNIFGHLDLTAIQPLYTFGKIAYRKDAAGRYVKVKEAQVEGKKGEVILQVARAYYGLILAKQGKTEVKDARTYLSETRQRIDRLLRLESPTVKETDRYRLAIFDGAIDKFAAEAEEGAKVAYRALKALIGYGPGQEFRVPLEMPKPAVPPFKLEHYIRKALDLRPEFTQLKEGLAARQLLLDAAKAEYYPSIFLALQGKLAGAPGRATLHDPYIEDYFNENTWGGFLGMHWHLDFGITKARIGQARAELNKLKNQQKTALMGIPVEVAKTYGKVKENYKKTVSLEKAYINARRWMVAALSDFDMGLGTMEDVFRAFENYGKYRGDYLMALYEYHLATVQMDKATGLYRVRLPGKSLKAGG